MRAGVALAALVVGCSFPDPSFEVARDDVSTDAAEETTVEVGPEDAADTAEADTLEDVVDVAEVDTRVDDPCDVDRDGYRAKGGSCGGNDCDDGDPRANPGVASFVTFDATGKSHGGDWNCNGTIERQLPINVSCGLLGGATCSATKGFTGSPVCGTSGKYVQCVTSGALCVEGTTKTEIQGCR